ncbi:GNAT family N-acetyltransferase [Flavobacterium limi]|uniref:Acetyltransferase (GNAT) domain-containing protein n=1 Tax=Flavobacterium limi TaxID=2045105 RepID=A0ABQ1UXJ0_9FLAO|nr:GNAT family protein [Flavobacterium limi]GGF27679.1 hypothetical protein GCM10011518_41290 [Flavobacterium limi]
MSFTNWKTDRIEAILPEEFFKLMNEVFICTSDVNLASQRIALKHNFKQEGILRDEFRNCDGELQNSVYFGLLKSEYK